MNIAKEGLALLMLHPSLDVQLHRECIFLIGTAWDIPMGDTQEVISLLDRELDAIRAAGEGGTVAHVLPEDELPMNATGLETLDNIWDLFETSLRMDSICRTLSGDMGPPVGDGNTHSLFPTLHFCIFRTSIASADSGSVR